MKSGPGAIPDHMGWPGSSLPGPEEGTTMHRGLPLLLAALISGGCHLGFIEQDPGAGMDVHIGDMSVDCLADGQEDRFRFRASTAGEETAVYVEVLMGADLVGDADLAPTAEEGLWEKMVPAAEVGASCSVFEDLLFNFVVEGANGSMETKQI